ncbi:NAD(P)/FAD-dependent oxidoreductase [uncultured Desulfobacter sp.]|uniref:NAD(P)/FAD-dependent oxidoreductase n=1 Tax=uncultured Desulfobacter sp. TaxID=240139 RepID=UPI002AAA97C3|nr:NAD(P)/FAD-dependent oxidoreductase [uncultured Desulfobacter sp.]
MTEHIEHTEYSEIIIIGAGPAGLTCARILAQAGRQVVLIERKKQPGPKVCAGGITWNGFLRHVPQQILQRTFPEQHIITPWQHVYVREEQPIIATVDRAELGSWMSEKAIQAGARILTQTKALHISDDRVVVQSQNQRRDIRYSFLIGADGANSMVRRYLNLPARFVGVALNAMLPMRREAMEWHLCPRYFRHGYGWIFPHKDAISVGAYIESGKLSTQTLKCNLMDWAREQGIIIPPHMIRAGRINFDYCGHMFGRISLIGEAAGFASGLTGEGIYPAIVSARCVAHTLLGYKAQSGEIKNLIKHQQRHSRMLKLAGRHPILGGVLTNALILMLRMRLIRFNTLELTE